MYLCAVKFAIAVITAVLLISALPALSDEKHMLTFTETVRGEMEDTAATKAGFRTVLFGFAHLSFTSYDVSDGEKLFLSHGEFRSADEAKRYFDWMLKRQTAQSIQQGDKTDHDGNIIGRRAEFVLNSEDKEKAGIIIWTQGVHVILVSAPTLACVQEFERQATK